MPTDNPTPINESPAIESEIPNNTIVIDDIKTTEGEPLIIYDGMLTLLGANGTGKTQLLRKLKDILKTSHVRNEKFIQFFAAGRIANIEPFRSYVQVHSSGVFDINFNKPAFVGKRSIQAIFEDESLSSIYQRLDDRPDILIKIKERLNKLLKKTIFITWQEGKLNISFADIDASEKIYPTGKEASGLLHFIGLLIALYDDAIDVLLIDEPEVSLHPQLQAFLLKELKQVAGIPQDNNNKKIIIIATHSTEMISITKPSDISHLAFCNGYEKPPTQIKQDHFIFNTPQAKQKKEYRSKIRKAIIEISQANKQVFFCQRPFIVEGKSDQLIIDAIADKNQTYLAATGAQLIAIEGIGNIPPVYEVLTLINKQPTLLVDADAMADNDELINNLLKQNQARLHEYNQNSVDGKLEERIKALYDDFNKIIQKLTKEKIIDKTQDFPFYDYYAKQEAEGNDSLLKRRLYFCWLFNNDTLEGEDKSIHKRFNKIMDELEDFGLFVLRKGTIESYYQHAKYDLHTSKIDLALKEADFIRESQQEQILQQHYPEILRCIKHVTKADPICEIDMIKDCLKYIYTSILDLFKNNKTNYSTKIREILNEKAVLFQVESHDNKLIININSPILDIATRELIITKDDDYNSIVKKIDAMQ